MKLLDLLVSFTRVRGTTSMNPDVGLGVVGTNTFTHGSPTTADITGASSLVTNATAQRPSVGYGMSTVRRKRRRCSPMTDWTIWLMAV